MQSSNPLFNEGGEMNPVEHQPISQQP